MRSFPASFIVVSIACGLSGCPKSGHDTASTSAPAAPAATPTPTGEHVIRGTAYYRERIKIPPGADFTVQLIDDQLADTPAAVIASSTQEDVAGPPYEFALSYDPAKVRPNGRYALSTTLRGVDGNLLFKNDTRTPVTMGDTKPLDILMVRVPGPGEPAPAPARIERSQWTCGGMTFDAAFDIPGQRVELALPDGALSLPLAQSASGARYADHRGNEFWTKGNTGTLTRAGGTKLDCARADAPIAAGSPWDKAKQRGIAFRAIGNEPGWLAEVGQGETPALQVELDYGQRKLDIAKAQSLSGLLGYAGRTADGTQVRLVLERISCSDGMSDNTYPVEAKLDVDGKTYQGCGRFLSE
jgi:uncharacterized lipoprotein YbaY/uncharacterized membrane protein